MITCQKVGKLYIIFINICLIFFFFLDLKDIDNDIKWLQTNNEPQDKIIEKWKNTYTRPLQKNQDLF